MNVLVTGGTGSLGRTLVSQLLADPRWTRVVVFSSDEFKQAMMHGHPMTREVFRDPRLRFMVGNVRDQARLARALIGIDAVLHTAAMKWVGHGVYNADEMFETNVGGTQHVIEASMARGVRAVLCVTSDKGCYPVNAYGVSKQAAERYAVSANAWTCPQGTRVACIRFGNLLWSRGSVAHRFTEAVRSGRLPLRLTDRAMTRFGIPLSEAARQAIWALGELRGGEIFVPACHPFRVEDVAHAAWTREGEPTAPTPLEVVGLRAGGEKRHETLLTAEESTQAMWVDRAQAWIVEPEIRTWTREPWAGDPVPEGWVHTSDKNDAWWTVQELKHSFAELDPGLPSA